jgi:hypothetical protein
MLSDEEKTMYRRAFIQMSKSNESAYKQLEQLLLSNDDSDKDLFQRCVIILIQYLQNSRRGYMAVLKHIEKQEME